jgi:hypothetical protein
MWRTVWSSLWKDVWSGVGWTVFLMSGIASIIKEAVVVFFPSAATPRVLFDASLRVCLILSAFLVLARQRSTIVEFERNKQQSKDNKSEQDRLNSRFAALMQEGKDLNDGISSLSGEQLADWDSEAESWKQRVKDFLAAAGWQTEIVPFLQAGDKAVPVMGPVNLGVKHEKRRRRMTLYSEKLEDIAQRRVPTEC